MKLFIFLLSTFLMANCGSNNSNSETKASNTETANKSDNTSKGTEGDGLVGEWELIGSVLDTNDNLQVDEAERKDMKMAAYKDYMKLNKDGTGLFTIAKLEGKYQTKAKENGGKEFLSWFDSANGEHPLGTIVKVSKDELHLKEPGGSGLLVWKRI